MESVLKKIVDDAQKRGHDVKIRDIAFALLQMQFQDENIAYTVVFGAPLSNDVIKDYTSLDSVKFLIRWWEKELAPKEIIKEQPEDIIKTIKKNDNIVDGSLSFEDNRAGIEKQIDEILELKKQLIDAEGNCKDVKTMATLQKTEADLRSKLNDKFGASEKSKEQYIIVQKKFDMICPHTRRECYQMTKEDAMKIWNLIEKE